MEANELLIRAVKELAASNALLRESREFTPSGTDKEALLAQIDSNDFLITAIRIFQMPVVMSVDDANRYIKGEKL